MSGLMLFAFLFLLAMSVPVAISIGLGSTAAVFGTDNLSMIVIAQQLFIAIDKYPLAAIPFFILAGNLMETGGISRRLVDFAKSIIGGIQGGLACSCVLTCMIFASVSGSSVANTVTVGSLTIPAMIRIGYRREFAGAVEAAASTAPANSRL